MSEGIKFDGAKMRYDLLPPDALHAVAAAYTYGSAKYGDRNWELGMAYSRLRGAAQRHLQAWDRGENIDAESGLPHLAMAAFGMLGLLSFQFRNIGTDDRAKLPASVALAMTALEAATAEGIERAKEIRKANVPAPVSIPVLMAHSEEDAFSAPPGKPSFLKRIGAI